MRRFPARTCHRRGTDAQLLPSVGGSSAESEDLADLGLHAHEVFEDGLRFHRSGGRECP